MLAQDPSLRIDARERDPAAEETSPDAMARRHPEDAGTVVEFKTLRRLGGQQMKDSDSTSRAAKDNLRSAVRQLLPHGNGEVVVDGRPLRMSESDARRATARFVGERTAHGKSLPQKITLILGDGRGYEWTSDV